MSKKPVKKECYDEYRKETCDTKGYHKPNHCNATILCKLDEILDRLDKCETDNQEIINQAGLVNVNVQSLVDAATGKKK